jgi:hypothetical protein
MLPSLAILLLCVTPADIDAALADRAQYPAAEHGYLYYVSTSHLAGEQAAKCQATLMFVVASTSQQQIIEKATPVPIAEGVYRLDLRELRWDWRHVQPLLLKYPYAYPGKLPLVVRADWLILQLVDTTKSNAYYQLLYGSDRFNRDDFLKAWGVNNDVQHHFGIITKSEAANGPSVAGLRLVENRPTSSRGSAWGTRDSAKITLASDPLQHLDGQFQHEAEEWLVAMPKVSLVTKERGSLLAAWLNDGKGKRQEEAPPAIVTDHHGFRGQQAIRNWGSCVSCHAAGINDPGVSELRQYIEAGVDVYATPKKLQEQIELFHLSDASKQIQRDNEDFAVGVRMCNGLSGAENAEAFTGTIEAYDRDVDLATASAELNTDQKTLALALANYNNAGYQLGMRLSGLPSGKAMSRATWEQVHYTAFLALETWRKGR